MTRDNVPIDISVAAQDQHGDYNFILIDLERKVILSDLSIQKIVKELLFALNQQKINTCKESERFLPNRISDNLDCH